MKVISNFIFPIAKERVCSSFVLWVWAVGLGEFFSFFWGIDWNLGLELVAKLSYCEIIKLKIWNKLVL